MITSSSFFMYEFIESNRYLQPVFVYGIDFSKKDSHLATDLELDANIVIGGRARHGRSSFWWSAAFRGSALQFFRQRIPPMQQSVEDYFAARRLWNAQYLQELRDGRHPHQPKPERTFDGLQFQESPQWCWVTSVEGSYLAPQTHTPGRVSQARIAMFEKSFSADLASKLVIEKTHRLSTEQEVRVELENQARRRAEYAASDAALAGRNQGNVITIPRVNQ